MDSKSIQNADTAGVKGYDVGKKDKKRSSIKLHIGVDVLELPHTVMLTAANVTDWRGAIDMVYYCNVTGNLFMLKKILADRGYTGEKFAGSIKSLCVANVEITKRSELHTFAVIPKRWVVERSFAWFDQCRRLWKNCERKLQNSFQMIIIAFIRLILKRY